MAENTLQFQWIVTIKGGLDHLFADDPHVFVAGDLFWYPVEGHPEIRVAPDALVAFGPPKGHRLSYLQWEEGGIAPQVVFEILSPGNRFGEMMRKFEFYGRYGVEEYYVYDPDPRRLDLTGFVRRGDSLVEVPSMNGHVSPRLKVRFDLSDQGLQVTRPDGLPFLTYEELAKREEDGRRRAEEQQRRAEEQQSRAEEQQRRAEEQQRRAEEQARRAEEQARRAEQALAEVEQLRNRLRSLGHDPAD